MARFALSPRHRTRPFNNESRHRGLCALFASLAALCLATHWPYLDLPFFWDELGYFIPAALDLWRSGDLLPSSVAPNIHPPAVMAWLAAVWNSVGYSVRSTRLAMLLPATLLLWTVMLLSREAGSELPARYALWPPLLLAFSPLFFTQAMMAMLDMPAALLTLLSLLAFLRKRYVLAVLASLLLVLTKETGALVPALCGAVLLKRRKPRTALLFALPLAALAAWLVYVARSTGSPFGNPEFSHYNALYPLHPFRAAAGLLRRLYFLCAANFHWAAFGAILVARYRTSAFRSEAWGLLGAIAALHILLVSLTGGAQLERYLLPVLPLFYIATAEAWARLPRWPRLLSQSLLAAGLIAGLFHNPPYPFPYENNLAMADFVRLHQQAARFLEESYPEAQVATAWPLSVALHRPEFGYVSRPLATVGFPDFRPASAVLLERARFDILVHYSRDWEPEGSWIRLPGVEPLWRRYFGYAPPLTAGQCAERFGLVSVARWQRRGQWVEILARP